MTKWTYPTSVQRFGSHLERVEHTTVDGVCGEQESECVWEESLPHMVLSSTASGLSSHEDRLGCAVEGIHPYARLATHPQHHRVIGRIVHQLHGKQLEAVFTPVKHNTLRSGTEPGSPAFEAADFLPEHERPQEHKWNVNVWQCPSAGKVTEGRR
jgi:hypothetical protein